MKTKRRNNSDIFGLSFLDIISCGFGAVVLLVLISDFEVNNKEIELKYDELSGQILKLANLKSEINLITSQQKNKKSNINKTGDINSLLADRLSLKEATLQFQLDELASLRVSLERIDDRVEANKRASIRSDSLKKRVEEVGGIPVDSEYVIFVVDTSGSMKNMWNKVTKYIVNVINIHPKVKGFQILNDNGEYLFSAYKGKWITDTKRMRKNSIDLFKIWSAMSNSSPVEGVKEALRTYGKANQSLSIYVFGDEFTGGNFDKALAEINALNFSLITKVKLGKIHAVEFKSPNSTGRFSILMRAVTGQNNGTFLSV